jgi:hypothetical protein
MQQSMRSLRRVIVASAFAALSCQPVLPPPSTAPAPAAAHATEQSQLLLFPQADGEALLGRAAQRAADGSWTIADARAPGCEVAVKREKAAFHASRQVDAHSLTALAGGYASVVSLEAKFGRTNHADIDVENAEILRADMRGACGALVVDTVFVGHGKRRITADAQSAAKADVHVGVISAAPAIDAAQSLDDAIEWKDDQAYGFSARENAKTEPLEVRVDLPTVLDEGSNVTARFESARRAWLVVYYIDGSGHADVLWPSNEEPEPMVAPGAPATLPSARERAGGIAYKATLIRPGQPSRETLVVYAFAEKADFDALKPAAGSENADGPAYAADLTKRLQDVQMSRWSRAVVGYVIQPATR